jgi:adenine-specific DNA-methyltransferase
MPNVDLRTSLSKSIHHFADLELSIASIELLKVLGYASEKRLVLSPNTKEQFSLSFDPQHKLDEKKSLYQSWKSIDLLFQLTDEEIKKGLGGQGGIFENKQVDNSIINSYLFFSLELSGEKYSRSDLAQVTREINKLFLMPVMVIFKNNGCITIGIVSRRLNKKDASRDVLEKVTLIKDIQISEPHHGQIDILSELALENLARNRQISNFIELQKAWEETLDISVLNKKFYKEIQSWYFWAVKNVTFPEGAGADLELRNQTSVIRMITRLIFVWFIKEKGLVPEELFDETKLKDILVSHNSNESVYYKAILQNLFFATLNTEMGEGRKFRSENDSGRDGHYLIHNVYRYKRYFKDPDAALKLFSVVPFLNGGLFECLDKEIEENGKRRVIRIDGFSDRDDNPVKIPGKLFFGSEHEEDLSDAYGDRSHAHDKVRGLLDIFNRYKFTIEENTPIEEEVALDPELLGKVFENLLAAYNPETGTTARKQTGSFYTPREIVNYMVDEALIAYLDGILAKGESNQNRLRNLLSYNQDLHYFNPMETSILIKAIDGIKVLDPACGSGAFPMGVLHKLVFILTKLDPDNKYWQGLQKQKAISDTEEAFQIGDQSERRQRLLDIDEAFENNASDYGRKLFLIENCIFGVDIQPIAVQISKLRFFISLVVDQAIKKGKNNLGIRPLPNLESKFVAADTLMTIEKPKQSMFRNPLISNKEKELAKVREALFIARTPSTKYQYRENDRQLREEISTLLKNDGWNDTTASKLAKWDPYDQNTSSDYFDPGWMFGIENGFDVVIGNPPYVNAKEMQKVIPAVRKNLKNNYYFLIEKWDIYLAFIEKALKISSYKSIITLIIPNAFVRENYSRKLREYLITNKIISTVTFYDYDIFEASVKNIVILITKPKAISFSQIVFSNPKENVHKNVSVEKIFNSTNSTLDYLLESELSLGDIYFISKGMVLNADENIAPGLFIKDDLISEKEDFTHSKRYTEGKWIDRYQIKKIKYLEWGTDRVPGKISRKTFPELYEMDKILTNKLGELKATYDDTKIYCDQTIRVLVRFADLYGIQNNSINISISKYSTKTRRDLEVISSKFENKYILALLNSKLYNFLLGLLRTKESFDINPQILRKLPIKEVSKEKQAEFTDLVETILRSSQTKQKDETYKCRLQIDRMVYEIFDLDENEIALIENKVPISTLDDHSSINTED